MYLFSKNRSLVLRRSYAALPSIASLLFENNPVVVPVSDFNRQRAGFGGVARRNERVGVTRRGSSRRN